MEAVVNPVQGAPRSLCRAVEETGPHRRLEWWVAFGEAKAHSREGSQETDDPSRGGCGSLEKAREDFESMSQDAYLLVRVSSAVRILYEGPLALEVSLSLRKLSGFGTEGEPVYRESVERREFLFSPDSREAVIPLLVATAAEQEALGVHEVVLMFKVEVVGERASPYGEVWVTSGTTGAELSLDGGVVGRVPEGGDLVLRNVPVGLREVRTRDTSGREVRKVVRVVPGRTVVADLGLPGPADSAAPYGLAPLGKNAEGHEEYQRASDGAVVVKIPAGEFLMGTRETERNPLEHQMYVSEFLMDKTGVTWGQYKRFAAATGTPLPPEPYWGIHDDHPVVFVTWEEARDYCEWSGGRLPTEAEREKAARGTDERMYPWGNEPPDPERAVHRRSWGLKATDPVGSHPRGASPYGLLDMGGNVWEWCADWYDEAYYEVSPPRDPTGPATGIAHVVRGGSWDSRPDVLSCSCRSFGHRGYREGDFGFRCAMNAPR